MKYKREGFWITAEDKKNKGFIDSQSISTNLLFDILEKLEEIRICIIDVEEVVLRVKGGE